MAAYEIIISDFSTHPLVRKYNAQASNKDLWVAVYRAKKLAFIASFEVFVGEYVHLSGVYGNFLRHREKLNEIVNAAVYSFAAKTASFCTKRRAVSRLGKKYGFLYEGGGLFVRDERVH